MRRTNRPVKKLKIQLLAALFCLPIPLVVCAQAGEREEAEQEQPPDIRRTFVIKNTNAFACAEVAMKRTGGQASHEIKLGPRWVERCLLKKVGTRLHECIRLKVEKATSDDKGVVRVETDQGNVNFWFEEGSTISSAKDAKIAAAAEGEGALVFTFPDNDMKYICAPFR